MYFSAGRRRGKYGSTMTTVPCGHFERVGALLEPMDGDRAFWDIDRVDGMHDIVLPKLSFRCRKAEHRSRGSRPGLTFPELWAV